MNIFLQFVQSTELLVLQEPMGSFHFDLPSTFSGHFGKNRIGEGGWARAEAKFIRWCGSDCGCWESGCPFSLFLECEGLE